MSLVLEYAKKLSFLKNYWREVIIAFLFCFLWMKSKKDQELLKEAYQTSVETLEEQVRGLQDIHKSELELRDEAIEKYQSDLEDLQEKYDAAVEMLIEELRYRSKRSYWQDRRNLWVQLCSLVCYYYLNH
jgi:hypothetical protein